MSRHEGAEGARKGQGRRILLGGERKGLGVGVRWALSTVTEGSVRPEQRPRRSAKLRAARPVGGAAAHSPEARRRPGSQPQGRDAFPE